MAFAIFEQILQKGQQNLQQQISKGVEEIELDTGKFPATSPGALFSKFLPNLSKMNFTSIQENMLGKLQLAVGSLPSVNNIKIPAAVSVIQNRGKESIGPLSQILSDGSKNFNVNAKLSQYIPSTENLQLKALGTPEIFQKIDETRDSLTSQTHSADEDPARSYDNQVAISQSNFSLQELVDVYDIQTTANLMIANNARVSNNIQDAFVSAVEGVQ